MHIGYLIGSIILFEGIAGLATADPERYSVVLVHGVSSSFYTNNDGIGERSLYYNGYPQEKLNAFRTDIDLYADLIDVGMLKFCYEDFPDPGEEIQDPTTTWENYRDTMIELQETYPNTTFVFNLHKASDVTISIYNMLGQKVANVVDMNYQAGEYNIKWNVGSEISSGIYFYEFRG